MKRCALLTLILLPLFAFGCGDSEPSAEDEVRETVTQVLDAKEPAQIEAVCNDLLSRDFLQEVYEGDVKACVDKPLNDEEGIENPGEVTIAGVEVDEPNATVKLETVGGDTDGTDGTWTVALEGDEWKVDRIEDDYLRAAFATSVKIVDGGMIAYPPMRKCMTGVVEDLDAAKVRAFTFQTMRPDQSKAFDTMNAIAEKGCPEELTSYVANELGDTVVAERVSSPAVVRCAKKEMAPFLELTGLNKMALKGANHYGDAGATAIAAVVQSAIDTCTKK